MRVSHIRLSNQWTPHERCLWKPFIPKPDLFLAGLAKYRVCHLPATVSPIDTTKQLRYSLDQIVPSGAGACADQVTDREESFEYPEEGRGLANAVSKRRNEFIVGRRCARAALAGIGMKPCALPPDESRMPQWPNGVTGSISHSVGLCCAVTAYTDLIACLGVDLETTTRISSGVIERVMHPLEEEFVKGNQAYGSLIFSVKESFFKAQFPVWKVWPNFDDLAFRVYPSAGRLDVIAASDRLPPELRSSAKRMQFRYAFLEGYVLTLCWLDKV